MPRWAADERQRGIPSGGGRDNQLVTLKRTHELFISEVELLAVTASPLKKCADLAADDCKQVCRPSIRRRYSGSAQV